MVSTVCTLVIQSQVILWIWPVYLMPWYNVTNKRVCITHSNPVFLQIIDRLRGWLDEINEVLSIRQVSSSDHEAKGCYVCEATLLAKCSICLSHHCTLREKACLLVFQESKNERWRVLLHQEAVSVPWKFIREATGTRSIASVDLSLRWNLPSICPATNWWRWSVSRKFLWEIVFLCNSNHDRKRR